MDVDLYQTVLLTDIYYCETVNGTCEDDFMCRTDDNVVTSYKMG